VAIPQFTFVATVQTACFHLHDGPDYSRNPKLGGGGVMVQHSKALIP
jgi:hypothetical protein